MSDSFSALGYNPAPGHPRLATNLANHLGSTASTLQETQRLLDGLDKQSSFWTGDAATKFTEQIHDLPDYLKRAEESLRGAKKELDGWSDSLSGMKKKADGLEADAQEAKTRLQHANEDMVTAKTDPDLRLAGLSFYNEDDLVSAQHRLDAAQQRVDNAIERVNRATAICKRSWTRRTSSPRSTRTRPRPTPTPSASMPRTTLPATPGRRSATGGTSTAVTC